MTAARALMLLSTTSRNALARVLHQRALRSGAKPLLLPSWDDLIRAARPSAPRPREESGG